MNAEGTQSARGTKLYTIRQNHEIKGQYNDFHGFGLSGPAFGLSGAAKDLPIRSGSPCLVPAAVQTALPYGPVPASWSGWPVRRV